MSVVIVGRRLCGKIEHHEKSYVATMMAHLNFLPIAPERGYAVFKDATGKERSFVIPRDRRSVLAVYARWWSFVIPLGSLLASAAAPHEDAPFLIGAGVLGYVGVLVWALRLGRLTAQQRAQRRFYAQITGNPLDPVHLAHAGSHVRAELHRTVAALGKNLGAGTYRTRHDPLVNWTAIALEPTMRSPAYLTGTLTLARLDLGLAVGARRAELNAAHDAIWDKLVALEPDAAAIDWTDWQVAAAQATPPPTPEEVAAQEAAAAAPAAQPFVFAAPRAPGRTFEHGWDIEIDPLRYTPPPACASCRGPASRMLKNKRRGLSLDIPYCAVCFPQAAGGWNSNRGRLLQLVVFAGGSAFGVVGLVPGVPIVAASVAATVLAIAGAALLVTLWPLQKFVAPATATVDGARLVAKRRDRATLFCTNEEWAAWMAAHHGSKAIPRTRPNRSLFVIPRYAPWAAPLAAAVLWDLGNPQVYVDNGFHEPVQLWVDGRPSIVIPPSTKKDHGAPSKLRLSHGHHVLGWSRLGAQAPERTTPAEIDIAGEHLYVPGALLCHYADINLYGSARDVSMPAGPIPVKEFQTFPRVDNWFRDNPETVESKSSGETRVAIKRWEGCEYLSSPPCPEGERARYWACLREVWSSSDEAAAKKCHDDTLAACGSTNE